MDTHHITILRCVATAVFPAAAGNSRVCDAEEGGCSPIRVGAGCALLINVAVPIELFLCCYITCKYVVLLEMRLWIHSVLSRILVVSYFKQSLDNIKCVYICCGHLLPKRFLLLLSKDVHILIQLLSYTIRLYILTLLWCIARKGNQQQAAKNVSDGDVIAWCGVVHDSEWFPAGGLSPPHNHNPPAPLCSKNLIYRLIQVLTILTWI